MKRLTIKMVLLFGVVSSFFSCYKDVIFPEFAIDPDGPPQAVSYNSTLKPLFNSKCTDAGCHNIGSHKPFLVSEVSYLQIVNGGYVNTSVPKESILYIKINGEMKEHIPSAADRQKVYDWIRTGALNN